MLKRLHHIGIAVNSLEKQLVWYRDTLGFKVLDIEKVESQKVKVALLVAGEVYVELLEPTSEESPIAKFLAKKGPGMHHMAYEVDDIHQAIAYFKEQGTRMIDEEPRPGAHNMQIAFIHPKSAQGVLTELCMP